MLEEEITMPTAERRIDYLPTVIGLLFFSFLFTIKNTPQFPVGIFIAITAFFFMLPLLNRRTETFIILILIGTSTVFVLYDFPAINIGIGDIYVFDLLVAVLLLGCLLKNVTLPTSIVPKPLGYAFLLLLLAALFSSLYAILVLNAETTNTGVAFRGIYYYLLFFLVFFYIKTPQQLNAVLLGISVLGVAVSLLIIVQNFVGFDIEIVAGRVEYLHIKEGGPLRVIPPGMLMMAFVFIVLIAIILFHKLKARHFLITSLATCSLLIGIMITFTRNLWVALTISIFAIIIAKHRNHPRLKASFKLILVAVIVLMLAFLFLKISPGSEDLINNLLARAKSITQAQDNFRNDTLYIRYVEARTAWETIKKNPLLGIGLGVPYNSLGSISPFGVRLTNSALIHNGYLSCQLRMGIMGTVSLFLMLGIYFYRSTKLWKRIGDPIYRLVVLGSISFILAVVFVNLFGSPFFMENSVSIIAVVMAITEKIFQFENLA